MNTRVCIWATLQNWSKLLPWTATGNNVSWNQSLNAIQPHKSLITLLYTIYIYYYIYTLSSSEMIHSAVWLDTKDAAQTTLKSLNVVDSSPSVIIFMGGILTRLSLNGRSMAFGFATLNAIKCHKHIKHTIYTPCLFALNATPSTENEEPTPKANMSSSRTWTANPMCGCWVACHEILSRTTYHKTKWQ